jgi:hypothetical protein
MPLGLRILPRRRAVAAAMVERFRMLPTANVSDVMSRLFAGGSRLRPMHRAGVLAGPALTVKTRPGDNLMIHKAIALAQPGDVIVVDAGGDLTNALIGELMLAQMVRRRLRASYSTAPSATTPPSRHRIFRSTRPASRIAAPIKTAPVRSMFQSPSAG